VIQNEQWMPKLMFNGDEVPFTLPTQYRQICAEDERVSVEKPNIAGHSKHRYGTLFPVVSGDSLLFMGLFFKGGSKVQSELNALAWKYKKWLKLYANKKAYMCVSLVALCVFVLLFLTSKFSGTTQHGK
jgi:hypothetical protein